MEAVYLLAVLVVAGYGIAWMVGGPVLANRYIRLSSVARLAPRSGESAWCSDSPAGSSVSQV